MLHEIGASLHLTVQLASRGVLLTRRDQLSLCCNLKALFVCFGFEFLLFPVCFSNSSSYDNKLRRALTLC